MYRSNPFVQRLKLRRRFLFFPWTSTAWDTENELLPNRFFRDSCAHFLISTWPLTDFKMEFAQIPFKWSRNSSARTGLCLVNYEVMGCQNVDTARTQFQVMHANYVKKILSSGFSWSPASLVASSGKPVWAKQVGKMVKQPSISQGAFKLQRNFNAKDGSKRYQNV